jgi:hypothetical protein
MQGEKAKKEEMVKWYWNLVGYAVIAIAFVALVVALVNSDTLPVKAKKSVTAKHISLVKSFKQISDAISRAAFVSQCVARDYTFIDAKVIEEEGERQARAKQQMALKLSGGAENTELDSNGLNPNDPEYMNRLEHDKWSWVVAELERQKAIRDAEMARVERVTRIHDWLTSEQGSPYADCAEWIVHEADRTGVNAYLCVAVGCAESCSGVANCGSYNAWGMLGHNFNSWEDAITFWFDNMLKHPSWAPWQTGYDIEKPPAYCETNQEEYAANVTGLIHSISGQ